MYKRRDYNDCDSKEASSSLPGVCLGLSCNYAYMHWFLSFTLGQSLHASMKSTYLSQLLTLDRPLLMHYASYVFWPDVIRSFPIQDRKSSKSTWTDFSCYFESGKPESESCFSENSWTRHFAWIQNVLHTACQMTTVLSLMTRSPGHVISLWQES